MPEQHFDPWLAAILFSLAGASILVWSGLIYTWQRQPFPPYEPRRPVPWNGAAALLAILFVAAAILSATYSSSEPRAKAEETSSFELVEGIGAGVLQQAVLIGAFVFVVVMTSGATLSDMGLPEYADGFVRDAKLGILAWLAALVPVFGLQAVLVALFKQQSQNPLIEVVSESPHPLVFVLAFVAAVIVAPICEELTFRLLLQGWLEKWEDNLTGWRDAVVSDSTINFVPLDPNETAVVDDSLPAADTPRRGAFGLPHGLFPILVSSTLFALAHFGYGPDPIPLFLFALILGFIYQRTHRIVPGIVAHAAFNCFTLVMLWRMIASGAAE